MEEMSPLMKIHIFKNKKKKKKIFQKNNPEKFKPRPKTN